MDINYVMPTGPETCKVTFEWYMDRDVYEKMPEEVRENMTRENLEERSVSKQNISVLTLFASNDELTQAVRCFYVIAMK